MLRIMVRGAVACLCAIAMAVALLPSVHANGAAQSPSAATVNPPSSASSKTGEGCHVLRVYLHGTQPATSECLDETSAGSQLGFVSPNITMRTCAGGDVHLWLDINYSGNLICFTGTGQANMADYRFGLFYSWDNNASSYWSNAWHVTYYKYANRGCPCFSDDSTGNLTGTVVGNDALSSIYISGLN